MSDDETMAVIRCTDPPPPELVAAVKALVDEGVPLNESGRFPFASLDGKGETIHGAVLGKARDRRVWVSKALADMVRA